MAIKMVSEDRLHQGQESGAALTSQTQVFKRRISCYLRISTWIINSELRLLIKGSFTLLLETPLDLG